MLYVCDICNYSTDKKSNYEKHGKTNKHMIKVHELQNENESVPKSSQKLPSAKKKLPKAPIWCQECGTSFAKKANLVRHMLRIHGIEKRKKMLKCNFVDAKSCPKTGTTMDEVDFSSTKNPPKNPENPPKSSKRKISKSTTCEHCAYIFSRSDALKRHYTRCKEKKTRLLELEKLKKENEELQEIKKENKELKEVNRDIIKTNKYAMSTFSYLAERFVDAPVLNMVDNEDFDTIMYKDHNTDNDFSLVESLIYYHRYRRLHEYIGDTIVALYKKDNPATQAIWNSDAQRLSYIIRTIVDDDPEWKRDNGGKKVLKLVINPILDHIDKKLNHYIRYLPEDGYHPKKFNEKILDAHKLSREFRDRNEIGRLVLGYITPFFHFRVGGMLELQE